MSRGRSPSSLKTKHTDLRGSMQTTSGDIVLEIGDSGSLAQPPHADGPLYKLLALDEALSYKAHVLGSKYVGRTAMKLFEHSGNGLLWLPLAALLIILPIDRTLRAFCVNLEFGFIIDVIIVGAIKALVKRPRPSYNNPVDYHVVNKIDNYSFPSGHASRATFLAVLCALYSVRLTTGGGALATVVLLWGFLTALSRAVMGRHYLSDVTAGCVVGFVTVLIVSMGSFSAFGLPFDE